MTEAETRKLGELVGEVRALQHQLDRMDVRLHEWMHNHEDQAAERDRAIGRLQAFRAQAVTIAALASAAVTAATEYLVNH